MLGSDICDIIPDSLDNAIQALGFDRESIEHEIMMNVEDFRIMFRAHLSHELWDKWRNGQLDVSMRRNTPDGCEYEELPKEAADRILDGGEIHSCEDLADPTEMISDRYACSLYGITTFKPSEYAVDEDFPNEVILLVRGWSVADFMSDWTKLNAVDE